MSAPLFLVDELPAGERFQLTGAEGRHAATVQRLRAGERLLLGDGRGGTAQAEVTAVGRGSLDLLLKSRAYAEPADPRLVVAQGLAKGERAELAVQMLTEAGADEILPWAARRSVVQWRGERGERAREKWVATVRESAKQSRRPWIPVVGGDPDLSTKQLVARMTGRTGLVLDESADARLSTAELPSSGEILLVVGPEGGIDPAEREMFAAVGARRVRLGDTVLRTSTAGVAALAVLAMRLRRW